MAESAIQVALYLSEKVFVFLWEELHRHSKIHDDIKDMKKQLRLMQACLVDAEGVVATRIMEVLIDLMRNVGYEMEDALDAYMIVAPHHFFKHGQRVYEKLHDFRRRHPLGDIELRMEVIKTQTNYIHGLPHFQQLLDHIRASGHGGSNNEVGESSASSSSSVIVEEDEVMGIDEDKETLINHLINDRETRCKTIYVVGPEGSGKTVLVRSVYNDKQVIRRFQCHAWISVSNSKPFKSDEFYRCLLSQFWVGIPHEWQTMPPEAAAHQIKNFLVEKRYIIVLDSASSNSEWSCIRNLFPNQKNGSRIIITTTDSRVASSSSCSDYTHQITGLTGKKSAWNLFCWKAFGDKNGKCPKELLELSQSIVTRCDSLPQAISAVGSLLSKKPKTPEQWQKVLHNLGEAVLTNDHSPSYYGLPKNLKSCLLYFAMLPEAYPIRKARLVRLWVAEGLVARGSRTKSMEEIAEEYLNELIARSLVQVSSKDFNGRVSSCQVPYLVREFMLVKSNEEKFAYVVTETMSSHPPENVRRLSFHNGYTSITNRNGKSLRTVRSFLIFGSCWDRTICSKQLSESLSSFTLLKVLDLEGMPLDTFPDSVFHLVLLRYLSLRNTKLRSIPKDIKDLRYLEFLDLKQTQVTSLPEEIWSLTYLRQLLVYTSCNAGKYVTFDDFIGAEVEGDSVPPVSLQKLSIIKRNKSDKFFSGLVQLSDLQKLGLVDLRAEDAALLCSCLDQMQKLSSLNLRSANRQVILNLDYVASPPPFIRNLYLKGCLHNLPNWVGSLNNLVKILLKWSKLTISPIELLQKLPNLMELEMCDAFVGRDLLFTDGGFMKLRTLRIEQFERLDTIIIGSSMRKLQKLTIFCCKRLHFLPEGIEHLQELEEFLLYEMSSAFVSELKENSGKVSHIPVVRAFTVGKDGSWQNT